MTVTKGNEGTRPVPLGASDASHRISHPAVNPGKSIWEIVDGMPPIQKTELFTLSGVILDDAITRTLAGRGNTFGDEVGLMITRQTTLAENVDPWGDLEGHNEFDGQRAIDIYIALTERDFDDGLNPDALGNGFSTTLEMHTDKLLINMGQGKTEAIEGATQRAYQRLTMIAAKTGINIRELLVSGSIESLVIDMSSFADVITESIPEIFKKYQQGRRPKPELEREGFKELARAAFPILLKLDHVDVPKPSEEKREQLWDWYIDLAIDHYYLPQDFFEDPPQS